MKTETILIIENFKKAVESNPNFWTAVDDPQSQENKFLADCMDAVSKEENIDPISAYRALTAQTEFTKVPELSTASAWRQATSAAEPAYAEETAGYYLYRYVCDLSVRKVKLTDFDKAATIDFIQKYL